IANDSPRTLCDRLGTSMVTIQSPFPEDLARSLRTDGQANVRTTKEDVRIEDVSRESAVALVSSILERHGTIISSIAIKQPTLDDVFLSLTTEALSS
ncbi:MAG: ABC transporter ATP-binding protein, partial [Rhodospirillaceae bacterium]|nr:ABC transporter ATP-binding protein [Rhodospirillaceae bacterium]